MVIYPAALDLLHALVEWVTMLIATREGDRRCKLRPSQRALVAVTTDPQGTVVWISPALTGRTHDLTAARTHRIINGCIRLGVPVLADMAYTGAGGTFAVPTKRRPSGELAVNQQAVNHAHARLALPRRTRHGQTQDLEDLPTRPPQPHLADVNHRRCPHP